MTYQIRTTRVELEDIANSYNLRNLESAARVLFYEYYKDNKRFPLTVSLDPDPVNSDVIIATLVENKNER